MVVAVPSFVETKRTLAACKGLHSIVEGFGVTAHTVTPFSQMQANWCIIILCYNGMESAARSGGPLLQGVAAEVLKVFGAASAVVAEIGHSATSTRVYLAGGR